MTPRNSKLVGLALLASLAVGTAGCVGEYSSAAIVVTAPAAAPTSEASSRGETADRAAQSKPALSSGYDHLIATTPATGGGAAAEVATPAPAAVELHRAMPE